MNKFPLNEAQKEILLTNGFLILDDVLVEECNGFYFGLFCTTGMGVFVTADVMMHLLHLVVEDMLMQLENQTLYDEVETLLHGLYTNTLNDYNLATNGSNLQVALERNLVFFGVGNTLLEVNITVPEGINDVIQSFVTKIENHSLIEFFPGEDYTQFTVRGRYEGDPKLERYFMVMKWLGRTIFRIFDD